MRRGLRFVRQDVRAWDVQEGDAYCGQLVLMDGEWRFESSDGSIRWNLGTTRKGAITKLRRRYHGSPRSSRPF